MIQARTQDNKSLIIFWMKETYYAMKVMASWTTLYELEGAKTGKDFI